MVQIHKKCKKEVVFSRETEEFGRPQKLYYCKFCDEIVDFDYEVEEKRSKCIAS